MQLMAEDLLEYTKKLPSLFELAKGKTLNVVEYEVEVGMCFGFGLINTPPIAAQLSVLSAGTDFPLHEHKEPVLVEWLHVYKGSIEITIDGISKVVKKYESICINRGEEHSVIALENTKILAVTMPAEKGFPDASV